jgi:membrane carboxypeptidase/penicillin-binding protein PbpC
LVEPRSGQTFHGPVRFRTALANDYLPPITQVLEQVGAENVWRLASNLGLGGLVEESESSLLQKGGRLTPLELAQAYSVFPSLGWLSGQRAASGAALASQTVLFVEDIRGRVLLQGVLSERTPVVSPALAYLVHDVLADEAARWPSLGHPNPFEIGRPAGAKAGSTEDGRQVWAAGYTANHVAVFWLGLPVDAAEGTRLDPRQAGAMWYAMLQYASRDIPITNWSQPPGLTRRTVCDPSGLLPTEACPNHVEELFLTGNEPVNADNLFQVVQINRETGRLATVFTPPELVDERVFMILPYEARAWAMENQMELPPEVYDAIQPPLPSEDVNLVAPPLFAYVSGMVEVRGTAAGADFQVYRLQAGEGLNPETWLQVSPDGTTPLRDGLLGTWDTTGLDGLYALRLLVVRDDQTIEDAIIQVTVDNTSPIVQVSYPLPGDVIALPVNRMVTLQAEASDALGIKRIEWWVDGSRIGESLTVPYSFAWQSTVGEHTLLIHAYDLAGNMSISNPVNFSIKR